MAGGISSNNREVLRRMQELYRRDVGSIYISDSVPVAHSTALTSTEVEEAFGPGLGKSEKQKVKDYWDLFK